MIRAFGAFTIAVAAIASASGQQDAVSASKSPAFNPMAVAKRPPALCDTYLFDVSQATGTMAFRRLYFQSEALRSAENGAKEGSRSVAKMKEAKNFTEMWTETLNGEQAWVDHMQCAAQIMYRYSPAQGDAPEASFAVLLTVAYNQQAHARQMLASSQKRRFLRTSEATPSQEFADAEELHGIQQEQSDSADSISKAGLLAAAEAEDLSDANAARVEKLLLTCNERQKISDLLKPIASDRESLFGRTARDMLSILADKRCK